MSHPLISPHRRVIVPFWAVRHLLVAVAIIALTIVAYFPSLHGPYLLDDTGNLEPIKRWLDGRLDAWNVVLDNRSGPTGRPLSMLTFLFDAWRQQGMQSVAFKTTNLAIHLCCGALVWAMTNQLLAVRMDDRRRRNAIALALATIWLWLPIHVSTVAYVVQRMAQLSALWMLATLVVYIALRRRLEHRSSPSTLATLWIGVPALAAAAALSKENGVLALPLVALVEWLVFTGKPRPRSVHVFLGLTVGLPMAIAIGFLVLHPDYFVRGYASRDFTLSQRLLTEPRILWDYLGTSFFPIGSSLGIYHDNYVLSQSLWHPVGTALAIVAWLGISAWAFLWRRKAPLFALGVFGYLLAHLLESGPIALEVYFEHRNYLPSVFALLACLGLVGHFATAYPVTKSFQGIACASLGVLAAIYGWATWNQASAWANAPDFYALQYSYDPTSPRLLSVMTGRAILAKDLPSALAYIDASERYENASEQPTSTLWRMIAYCETGDTPIPSAIYEQLEARNHGRITTFAMVAWDLLGNSVQDGCKGLDDSRTARAGIAWLERTPQPGREQMVWRTRYNVGRILAANGDLAGAEALVHRAWIDSDRNNGVGVLLFQLSATLGHVDLSEQALGALQKAYGRGDKTLDDAVDTFNKAMPDLRKAHPRP